ncbi:hypothetical protein M4951_25155 [Blastopirellula sp. J2-11]|uniref:hypothetical protein n=1 Tax=Blastopirellula sp. J2-11 TaxID=2943192 RepID=UPI0021C93C57|nr:hypothetical protein [Blastopirellula sp. J2-11]UUO06619.1 hypothetical protein M4951_25155 [Blastopirellula sp. J2-11]
MKPSRAVCTIVTKSHLAYARGLAHSLKEHEPGLTLYVLLADRIDDYFIPEDEPFQLVRLEDLYFQEPLVRMSFYYSPFEFCCAIRPHLHHYMMASTDCDQWIYLDSDIIVCGKLEPIFAQLQQSPLLISPHLTTINDMSLSVEVGVIKYGIYNGGCIALRRSQLAERFIEWFRTRLEFYALNRDRLSGDQPWLNLVPIAFPEMLELRHPGTNVGYWNLHERQIDVDADGNFTANGQPLIFAHFSGGDFANPEHVFTRGKQFDAPITDALRQLFRKYVHYVTSSDLSTTSQWPYTFNYFNDGSEISPQMRTGYYKQALSGTVATSSPFEHPLQFRPAAEKQLPRKRLKTKVREFLKSSFNLFRSAQSI